MNIKTTASKSRMILQSATNLFIRVSGAGLGFLFNVILTRSLSADQVGIYQLALTFILIASVVARVGMDASILKFASMCQVEENWQKLKSLHDYIMIFVILTSSTIGGAIYAMADVIAEKGFDEPEAAGAIRLMSAALLPLSLLNLYGELLKAGRRQALASIVQSTALPFLNLVAIVLFKEQIASAAEAVGIYFFSTVLVAFTGYLSWRIRLKKPSGMKTGKISFGEILGTSIHTYASAVADISMTFLDVLLLGIWVNSAEVAIYAMAARTAQLTRFVLLATNSVVAPRFAALHHQGDQEKLKRVVQQSTWLISVLTVPVILLFWIFPEWVLSLFGNQYKSGTMILMILSFGQFINSMTGPGGYLLNMTGHHKIEARLSILGALTSVIICCILIPRQGAIGAAMANAFAISISNLFRVYFAYTYLKVLLLPTFRFR